MNLETNHELLKLAAKAAGTELTWDCEDRIDEPWTVVKGIVCAYWNPIFDDGDALELVVKLGMSLRVVHGMAGWTDTEVEISPGMIIRVTEPHRQDAKAATRLAIVRAAAEIGRAMQPNFFKTPVIEEDEDLQMLMDRDMGDN